MKNITFFLLVVFMLGVIPSFAAQTIVCSTDNIQGSLHVVALEEFGRRLEEYSHGELTAQIHYQGNTQYPSIRGEEVNVNMILNGRGGIHVTSVFVGNLSQRVEVLGFFTLPYLFQDRESVERLFTSTFMQEEINDILRTEYDIRALGWLIGGLRNLTNSQREVTRIEDMKGLNIRVSRNRVMVDTYEALGADVTPLDWGKTFEALQQKKVDGQENPYSTIVTSKFWDAHQKYVTNNGPFLWVGPILMNNTFYQSLSQHHQAIVDRAALEASQFEWTWIAEQNDHFRNTLKEHGMKILELEDKERWIQATRRVWDDYYNIIGRGDKVAGKAIVEGAIEAMSKE